MESDTEGHELYFWDGGSGTGYSNYQLSKCASHKIGEEDFTVDSVKEYAKKRVYLTVESTNPKIEIPTPKKS